MVEKILGSLGLSFLAKLVAKVLGGIDSETAQKAAEALQKVDGEIDSGDISFEQVKEANRHLETIAASDAIALKTINDSIQAEIASQDTYVRRMRPTFGYVMAVTWAAQMLAVAYIVVFDTGKASIVINAIESLSAIWAMGLSVLGVYVYKRSEDKKRSLGF